MSCHAKGHSGYAARNADIVCSAVSIMLRTAEMVISDIEEVVIDKNCKYRGFFSFDIKKKSVKETVLELIFVEKFLEKGFLSLQEEFPQNVKVDILTEEI